VTVGLSVQRLRYQVEATSTLILDQQPGSALRGALFHALLQRFCALPTQPLCASCPLIASCPVAALVAPLRDEPARGRDIPRPFVLRPPLRATTSPAGLTLQAGATFTFELVLFGDAIRLFPYIALSSPIMERNGLGRSLRENGGKRGSLIIREIVAITPDKTTQSIYTHGQTAIQQLPPAVVAPEVIARAAAVNATRITLLFVTPTRLIAEGKLVHAPQPAVLVQRLAERLDALEREYIPDVSAAGGSGRWRAVAEGAKLELTEWTGSWVETQGFSTRQGRALPLGGFVGQATFTGGLSLPLRELLAWGEFVHVGKNAVKGDGWYLISP